MISLLIDLFCFKQFFFVNCVLFLLLVYVCYLELALPGLLVHNKPFCTALVESRCEIIRFDVLFHFCAQKLLLLYNVVDGASILGILFEDKFEQICDLTMLVTRDVVTITIDPFVNVFF